MCRKLIYLTSFVLMLELVLTSAASAIDPNLVGWWKLDETSGTTANDSSGSGNTGTLTNGPLWAAGRIGGALNFDGTDDYVGCGNAASLNITSQITLSLWVNTDTVASGTHRSYLMKGDTSYALKQGSPGNIEFFVRIGGVWQAVTFPVDASFNGVWHHLAGTYDRSQIKLYVDGVLRDTKNVVGAISTNTAVVSIGSDAAGSRRYCDGRIDDARIYNRALSQTEIKKLANPERASIPIPANGSIITQPEVTLQWDAGILAALHDVYFGENFADVNNATTSTAGIYKGRQSQNYYPTTGTMAVEIGKTYYWRIDEVRADGTTIDRGEVWSFSVQPLTAYNPSPDDETKYIDLNADLSWSAGAKVQSHDVYFGTDETRVTDANNKPGVWPEFKGNLPKTTLTYALPTLAYDTSYYWRIDEVNVGTPGSPWTGYEWEFKTVPFTPITDPNLVGWWKLDDGGGSIALDWSGRHNNGTVIGDPNWVAGHIGDGNALDLDGFDDCINCGNPQDFNIPTQITLAAWVKTDAAGNGATQSYVTKMVGGENSSYTLRHIDTNNVEFLIGTASATFPVSSSFNGIWHHLAGTYDGIALRLYVDGSLEATTANVGAIPTSAYNVNIGRDSIGNRFPYDGAIDDVRIYNRALTADEIGKIVAPLEAWDPSPGNGATNVEPTLTLIWKPGIKAALHRVYFDPNEQKVIDRSGCDVNGFSTTNPSYSITTLLEPEWTYYWAVDEVNDPNIWPGRVWSFKTVSPVVEDFDSYVVTDPNLYAVWNDWSANGTQAQISLVDDPNHTPPGDSMNYYYRNAYDPWYSEAYADTADLPSGIGKDWTAGGVKALMLYFYGQAGNDANEKMYVKLSDADSDAVVTYGDNPDEDPNYVKDANWHEWNIDLADFTGVSLNNVARITIGFGDGSDPYPASGTGTVFFDDIRLYPPRCAPDLLRSAADFTGSDCLVDYQDLVILTNNWLISEYQVTPQVGWDPNSDPNLEGWYRFEGDLLDSSGNNHTGDPCGTSPAYVAGNIGQALSFDGVDDYVAVTQMVQDDFTLTAWLKTATPGAQAGAGTKAWQGSGLIWSDVAGGQPDFILAVLGAKLSFGTGPADQDTSSSGDVVTGQWVHVAVTRTRSSGRVELFINGVLDPTVIHTNTGSLNANPEIHIGGNTVDSRYYTGLIDDVRIYSRALSQGEIAYLAGKTAPFTQPLELLLTPQNLGIDLYNDGRIDLKDFALLTKQWLKEELWP